MKTFTALCFTIVLVSISLVSRAQLPCPVYNGNEPPVAEGLEFLLCFMANELPTYPDNQYQDIYLASLNKPARVTVVCKALNINKTFDLGVYDTVTYHISREIARPEGALIYSTEVIDSSCIYINSTEPIICYGMNHKLYTTDAFLALPKHTADMHHMIISYANSAFTQNLSERASEFAVAAWDDSTIVKIVPKTVTSSGITGEMEFRLNKYEAVQIQANPFTNLGDMTGSTITSSKPVAVWGGHERAEVPVGYQQPGLNSTSRDHLAEQIPPTTRWGKSFVTSNFFRGSSNEQADLMRVLARDNDTRVSVNGTQVAVLNAGEFYDQLLVGPALVEASGFALVGMYAHTTATDKGIGDPFLAIVPPVEQLHNSFTFFISDDPAYTDQHVLIFTESSGPANGIFIDDSLIPAAAFTQISGNLGGVQYSYIDFALPGGIHRVRTNNTQPGKGIAIVAYGWGEVDSYGYTAGSLLRPTNGIIPGDGPKVSIPRDAVVEPKVWLRNVFNQRLYYDKATLTLDDAFQNYSVDLKKNIALDVRYIEPGDLHGLDLVVTPPNTETIRGTMKVEYHGSRWRNLAPATVPFVIHPQVTAAVGDEMADAQAVTLHPNPVQGTSTVLSISVEQVGPVAVRVLDATGREVLQITRPRVSVGVENIQIDTRDLPAGVYTCEIALPEQGTTMHRQLVVMK